jgi:N utilization substance protein A
MASELYNTIDALSREKGIDPQIVVSAVEDAIVVATRKYYKSQENLRAELDKETGKIRAFAVKTVVENPEQVEDPQLQVTLEDARKVNPDVELGGELQIPKVTEGILGRIAAQLAKQVIFQKVREAERDTVYNEYIGRVGEIVNASVKRIEGPDVIFDIGKAEARMPRKEQSRLESFAMGERIRVVIARVERASKGPGVVVSRAVPELVQHLFQTEVPEIYDGTVVIRAIAREAGERTKIAVMSKDKDVDAVGACVGMKGMRVQSIIRELRGEKIDIIPYNEETVAFAQKALSPAKVTRVQIVDPEEKRLEVIVEDTQLSLAIGKKGQNVRLASKLVGWNIDIKSEEEKRREIEEQMAALTAPGTPLSELAGIGPKTIEKLESHGVTQIEKLAEMTPEQLMEIPGIGEKMVEKIRLAVTSYFENLESQQAAAAESAAAETAKEAAPEVAVEEAAAPAEPASEETAALAETSEEKAEASEETAGASEEKAEAPEEKTEASEVKAEDSESAAQESAAEGEEPAEPAPAKEQE